MASEAVLSLILNLRDNATAGLSKVSGTLDGLGATAAKLAGGAALGGVVALGGGLAAAAVSGLRMNMSMENVTAQLNALTKDGGKSADILEMIRERASKTPFAFEEMAKATTGLLPAATQSGMALEDLVAQAEILAASNPAEGLEGAAFALREAVGGDFQSAIERFNLPRQLINQLKEEGVPNLEIVGQAMKAMGYDADLVSNLAETASGRWSTFTDTLTNLAATATQPLFEGLSGSLAQVQVLLDANGPALTAFATALGQGLVVSIQGAIAGFSGFMAVVGPIASFIGSNLQPILAGLGAALVALAPIIYTAVIPPFIAWAAASATAAAATIAAMAPVVIPIVAIGAAVALLVAAWTRDWGGIRSTIEGFWNTTGRPIFESLRTWLASTLTAALTTLAGFWTGTLLPALRGVWSFISGDVIPLLTRLGGSVFGALQSALSTLAGFWNDTLLPAIKAVWSFIDTYVVPIFTGLVTVQIAALKVALAALQVVWENVLLPAIRGVWSFLDTNVVPILKALAETWIEGVSRTLTSMAQVWTDTVMPALRTASSFISETLSPVIGGVTGAINSLIAALEKAKGWLDRVGDAIRNIPKLPSFKLSLPDIPGFDQGVSNFGGGLAYVHRGEMLSYLPRGANVYTAAQTRQMIGGGSGITVQPGGSYVAEQRVVHLHVSQPMNIESEMAGLDAWARVGT